MRQVFPVDFLIGRFASITYGFHFLFCHFELVCDSEAFLVSYEKCGSIQAIHG